MNEQNLLIFSPKIFSNTSLFIFVVHTVCKWLECCLYEAHIIAIFLSNRNQLFELLCKSTDWIQYGSNVLNEFWHIHYILYQCFLNTITVWHICGFIAEALNKAGDHKWLFPLDIFGTAKALDEHFQIVKPCMHFRNISVWNQAITLSLMSAHFAEKS